MPNDFHALLSRLPKPSLRQRRTLAMTGAAALVVVSLGAFGFLPAVRAVKDTNPVEIASNSDNGNDSDHAPPRMLEGTAPFSFADLVERVSPAVVTITSETMTTDGDEDEDGVPDNIPAPFRDLFNQFNQQHPQAPRKAISAGSGFIIDKAGYIVTNNHVIDASKKITVKLPDGRSFTAKLIGTDQPTDIALLKINSDKPLPTVEFGNDRALRVGDWVVAVGNPFGLSNSVTAGIVSSLGRDIGAGSYNDFIQIDAPINRGNSGGPTFDLRGQVVGMNSMIFSPSGGSVGIGFAIPASTIHDVVAQLKAHGRVARGWLGVEIQPVTADIAGALGLKDAKGAIVANVVPGSPAAKGGFENGDVVTAIDSKPVEDARDLTRQVALVPSGQTATFLVNRQGTAHTLHVTIGTKPEDKVASTAGPTIQGQAAQVVANTMGLGLAALTPEARHTYNLADGITGAVITRVDPDSDAAEKGLQPGDVVLKINSRTVKAPQDVKDGVSDAQKGGRKSVLLFVVTQEGQHWIPVDIGQT